MSNRPNRRYRRNLAAALGLDKVKRKAPLNEKMEMIRRSIEVGKQIHISHIEENYNKQLDSKIQKEVDTLKDSVKEEPEQRIETDLSWMQNNVNNDFFISDPTEEN